MNARQTVMQMRYRLRNRDWPGGSNAVFGSVHVSEAPTSEAVEEFRFPLCLLKPLDEVPDPKLADLGVLNVDATIVVSVSGDIIGEGAFIGANRADATKSEGYGVLDVETQLKSVLQQMQNEEGIRIITRRLLEQRAGIVSTMGHVLERTHRFALRVTTDAYYHPVRELTATAAGGGDVDLTWKDPPDRFDRRRIMIRRASGATAPEDETSGTLVSDSVAIGTEAYTDSPGVGQFSYALFAAYTDTGAAEDQNFSDQEKGTYRTVTAT